ncbi:Cyclomaltodextrinase [Paenibacillus darwinianus]|uniref:Cyclomaltodextrinase n=1 Tax=Paenibacillus darwinianus TaxID=1380763 RepID=A0A9W5W6T7_9BACL|nr:alpha-glycosidase [Paenibacillus darwinianus]EXX86029.1 Cyclomaltodextrinase [Paenibacillus darwinianus]EXX86160.1 Cyclomaltodextrinase [Paenibacillus darwinianus]EXX86481.1 Cyclomaltodextrinase [Paenibacillus darwinianus]
MLLECFHHATRSNWAYAYDEKTIHLRFRTKRDDVDEVYAITGDKYDWEAHYKELKMDKLASDHFFDYWEIGIRPMHKRFSYGFRIRAGNETVWMVESGISHEQPTPPGGYYEFPYIHPVDIFRAPEWAKEAVFYQIFPDRFANGDPSNDPEGSKEWGGQPEQGGFFGGDLKGVMDNLEYLTDLGINAIYFTPLFKSPSNHKYDTIDYMEIDPQFGTKDDLRRLVQECHKKGIRVVLDAVFNHSGVEFAPFQDVVRNGDNSKYKDWFHIHSFPVTVDENPANYDTFGFYGHMPKLNTANPEVKKYLLDVATYWLQEMDIDGWRLDVANEIDHRFWRDFRVAVKAIKPDAYIVGEVWSDSMLWLMGDQFDSVMNYPFADKTLSFFSNCDKDGYMFANEISRLLIRYPQQTNEVIFNLLCSHDTPRVLTMLGEDKRRLKLALVFLLTYIGTPCIFYGDEVGLRGGGDPDCRKCMEWDYDRQDRELYDFYKLIIALRKNYPMLRHGRFRFLKAEPGDCRVIYERLDDEMHFTVWMNNTTERTVLSHPMETNDWHDALSGQRVEVTDGAMNLELDELGYRIIYRKII